MARQRPQPRPRFVPERGDIIWLDFDPQSGREQAGHRLAIVLSHAAYNGRFGLAIVCPITTAVKGYTWEVPIPDDLEDVKGVVLADQIKSIDWRARNAEFKCKAPAELLQEILELIYPLIEEEEPAE
jgi:mRNA interferase MazF